MFDWRQLELTSPAVMAAVLPGLAADGVRAVTVDVSAVVDAAEDPVPAARSGKVALVRDRLARFVAAAAQNGMSVNVACGSPHWVKPQVRYVLSYVTRLVDAVNAGSASARRVGVAGVVLDVEPWAAADWFSSPVRAVQFVDTVSYLVALRNAMEYPVPVTVAVPPNLDGTMYPHTVSIDGVAASPTAQVVRVLSGGAARVKDRLLVMAYRNHVSGAGGVVDVSAGEVALVRATGGAVGLVVGLELGDVSAASSTFYSRGWPAAQAAVGQVMRRFADESWFTGIAFDHVQAWSQLNTS